MPHTVETTITLDADVLESAREYAQTGGVSLDQVITDALRQALESTWKNRGTEMAYASCGVEADQS